MRGVENKKKLRFWDLKYFKELFTLNRCKNYFEYYVFSVQIYVFPGGVVCQLLIPKRILCLIFHLTEILNVRKLST